VPLEPYIDAHSHVWTPDVVHYPLGPGSKVENMNPRSFTAEELLMLCRPAGVGSVNLIQEGFYKFDNKYMLDMIKMYPDRFVGTVVIDPAGPDPGQELIKMIPLGVRACRIYPSLTKAPASSWLQSEGYDKMFAASVKTGLVLSCLIDPSAFPEVDRMCRKHPDAKVIIDHLGLIGASGTIDQKDVDALCALARHPNLLIKVGAFYFLGRKMPPYTDLGPLIKSVVQAYGARRCMWESDCPFQVVRDKYTDSIDLIRTRLDFLTAEDREWLLRRTAEAHIFRPMG
jgi:predicted TIM-barrel fold metal-dependent hydrolase